MTRPARVAHPPERMDVDKLYELARVRWEFLETAAKGDLHQPPVRDAVARSWSRALEAGVNPHLQRVDATRPPAVPKPLRAAAARVLQSLSSELTDQHATILVSDPSGTIAEVAGDRAVLRMLERAGAAPGHWLQEDTAGTNGIGTALAEGQGLTVVGGEHFIEAFQHFACTCYPLRGPAGEIIGAIDLTTKAVDYRPTFPSFVGRLAEDIEGLVRTALLEDERSLLHVFCRMTESHRDLCVIAVDERGRVIASKTAIAMLSGVLEHVVEALLARAKAGQRMWTDLLCTPSGERLRIEVRATSDSLYGCGAVALVKQVQKDTRGRGGASSISMPTGIIGTSPQFVDAVQRILLALESGSVVLITGEQGTGKSAVSQAVAREYGHSEGKDPEGEIHGPSGVPCGHVTVIDDVDQMSDEQQEALLQKVRKTGRRPIILVARREEGVAQQWGALVEVKVSLPPLRERTEDILPLAYEFMRKHQIRRTFSSAAARALRNYDWPGNIPELYSAVQHAARVCRGWVIEVADLPDAVAEVATLGELSQWERLEIAALRAALRAARGNRSEAAARLGISRATLYRKLARYHLV